MAKILFTAIVADVRGKIAGTVFSKNRYGAYARTKVTPVNRNTVKQQGARAILTIVSQAWKCLSEAQRKGWNEGAKNFIRTNVFGDVRNLSGSALFARLNANLLHIGESRIVNCPLPVSVPSVVTLSGAAVNSVQSMTLTFSPAIDAGVSVEVYATAGLSAGKNFVKSEFKKIATKSSAFETGGSIAADYATVFGAVPAAGTKVFVQLKHVDNATGQPGAVVKTSFIVVA